MLKHAYPNFRNTISGLGSGANFSPQRRHSGPSTHQLRLQHSEQILREGFSAPGREPLLSIRVPLRASSQDLHADCRPSFARDER